MEIGLIWALSFIIVVVACATLILLFTNKTNFTNKIKRFMATGFSMLIALSIVSAIESYLSTLSYVTYWRMILSILAYWIRPFVLLTLVFTMYNPKAKKEYLILSIPSFINVIVYFTAFFSSITFSFNDANEFQRGPLGFTVFAVCGIYALVLLAFAIKNFIIKKKATGLIVLFCIIVTVLAAVSEIFIRCDGLYNSVLALSFLIYYLFLNVQYAKENEKKILENQKTELMLSQIQPHFMYNVLSSIYYLCDHDTKKAKEAINLFSGYLRTNLDTIRGDSIVDFKDELAYAKNYLALEKIRFENELRITYNIETMNFKLPKFTIQPLVENSVKHGISQKEAGGLIEIYTKEEADCYIVGIKDDGVGFDINEKPKDGKSHTGIENVNSRIYNYCQNELKIESEKGKGCHIWFKINK